MSNAFHKPKLDSTLSSNTPSDQATNQSSSQACEQNRISKMLNGEKTPPCPQKGGKHNKKSKNKTNQNQFKNKFLKSFKSPQKLHKSKSKSKKKFLKTKIEYYCY